MLVIPVIDVRGGEAVAAVRGDRAAYRPLRTPLAAGSDPVAVALGLYALFPFPTLYVADLDGIEGRGPDRTVQAKLAAAWPGQELWIDDGSNGDQDGDGGPPPLLTSPTRGEGSPRARGSLQVPSPLWGGLEWGDSHGRKTEGHMIKSHVLGSESQTSMDAYLRARETSGPHAPLSLDFRGDAFLGPPDLFQDATRWPDRVIVMTLARVGSGEGPDLARLADVVARAQGRAVFAAGGVRNADDLIAVRDTGAAGALVATALHSGAITPADLAALGAESDG